MSQPISSVSGLVSGINYRDLVDQIITSEGRPAQRARDEISRITSRTTALGTYRNLLTAVQSAARNLRTGAAFDGVSVSAAAVSGARALVTAAGSAGAAPGSYRVQVTALAQAQKLGTTAVASTTQALGLPAGSFTINGAAVAVDATDTLTSLRDKINAANTGPAASKVAASILQVGAGQFRLVLTSETTGAAGMTLANVSGGIPQALGLTDAQGALAAGAVIVAGADAQFSVDGVAMTRPGNVVTDAVAGLTLTLVAQEAGAVTNVTVERSVDAARGGMQAFVDAWNKLVDFVKEQQAAPAPGRTPAPLYGDSLLRLASGTLARTLLGSVSGTAADLSTAGLAGVSLAQTGKLSLDTARFDAAFKDRFGDLRTLFALSGTSTAASLGYVSASADTAAGTYGVAITQAATQATVTGSGFGGTYADDGTPDTLTVTETGSAVAVSVSLADGMTTAQVVSALNAAFSASARQKVASGTVLYGDPAGTVPMTAATTFADLRAAGGAGFGVLGNDTVSFSGTRPDGSTFQGTFTVTDPATATVGQLAGQVQAAIGSSATVSVVGGRIVVEDTQARTSPLTLTLTATNQGGGTLAFGGPSITTTGRPALNLTATAVGNDLRIVANDFGSGAGFSVALAGGGTDGTAQLGLAAGSYAGLDVAGTIAGNAATGSGRTLTGATGTAVDGLVVQYAGTSTGAVGSVAVTVGAGALLERSLDEWLTAGSGTLATKETGLRTRSQGLQERASLIDARLERRRTRLLSQFARMESALGRLQSQSSGLTAMLGAFTQRS